MSTFRKQEEIQEEGEKNKKTEQLKAFLKLVLISLVLLVEDLKFIVLFFQHIFQ